MKDCEEHWKIQATLYAEDISFGLFYHFDNHYSLKVCVLPTSLTLAGPGRDTLIQYTISPHQDAKLQSIFYLVEGKCQMF